MSNIQNNDLLFHGLWISVTGLQLHIKEQIRKLVETCGGVFDEDMNIETTTHLIANIVGTKKYQSAKQYNIPIVTSEWLFHSYRAQELLDVRQYKLNIFEGLVLCTTGLTEDSREQVMQLSTQYGGSYDSNLEVGYTSVLIAQEPQGPKYSIAIQYDIPVVPLSWLYACIEKQEYIETQLFQLQEEVQPKHLLRHIQSDLKTTYEALPENYETTLLNTCVLYFLGFNPTLYKTMRHLVRMCTGTLYYEINPYHVTHVLVAPTPDKGLRISDIENSIQQYIHLNPGLYFVSPQWLIDSVKNQRLEPEDLYPVELEDLADTLDAIPDETDVAEVQNVQANTTNDVQSEELDTQTSINNAEDGLSVEIRDDPVNQKVSSTLADCKFLVLCIDPNESLVLGNMFNKLRNITLDSYLLDVRDALVLDEVQMKEITHVVICSGVSLSEDVATELRARAHRKVRFVSDLWLRCCMTADKLLLPRHTHEFFEMTHQQPYSMFPKLLPLKCFQGIRASTSVYMGIDRIVVVECLEMAGAVTTSKLTKKNTHLICLSPIGLKYEKAKQWNIKVVTARWIVQSLIAGEVLDESNPDFQLPSSADNIE